MHEIQMQSLEHRKIALHCYFKKGYYHVVNIPFIT